MAAFDGQETDRAMDRPLHPADTSGLFSPAWLGRLAARVGADAEMAHVGRWSSLQLGLFCDNRGGLVTVEAGKVVEIVGDSAAASPEAVLLNGSARAWAAFLQPVPPRLHNDILAMDRRQPDFEIGGSRPALIRNLRYIELMMARCREIGAAA